MNRLCALFLWAAVGCSAPEVAVDETGLPVDDRLSVYVVSYPLEYFAERIGGESVSVSFPVPAGVDPASWHPGPATMASYQQADVIVLNGAGYAKWVETAALPGSKLVDTSKSFQDRIIVLEDAVVHSHGPEGEHSHGEIASLTWLDPRLAIEQARAVKDALVAARPEDESMFVENFAALEADLTTLDRGLETAFATSMARGFVAAQPVYPYLARRYGLVVPAVSFGSGPLPETSSWHDLEHLLEDHKADAILMTASPAAETADKLKEHGLDVVVFDVCDRRPSSGDYLSVMSANVSGLEALNTR